MKKRSTRQSGSAVMGHVFSVGNKRVIKLTKHIDKWFQYSYKIKGTYATKNYKKRWTFEIGYLSHQNNQFFDGLVLNMIRDWASLKDKSFLANFKLEYSLSLPLKRENRVGFRKYSTFQKLIIGRNYHIGKHVLTLEMGLKWEVFKDNTRKSGNFSETQLILAPSLNW